VALVPVRSLPLFAFATDGSIAWLRASGSRVLAVDARTGEVVREINLDPTPFGLTWSIERVGGFFIVKDDQELSAFSSDSGQRLWKRTFPSRIAFIGPHPSTVPSANDDDEGERHISIVPTGEGVDIALADLKTGELKTMLNVEGTMRYVGAHGTLADDLLYFATDERDVYAVDVNRWEVVAKHPMPGSYVLPPISTGAGVHIAAIERRAAGAVTHITTIDRSTGAITSTHEIPGAANSFDEGAGGLVLDVRRSPAGILERVAFRPDAPHLRLVVPKHVEVSLAVPRGLFSDGNSKIQILPVVTPEAAARAAGEGPREQKRPTIVPGFGPDAPVANDRDDEGCSRDGFHLLFELLGAKSDLLQRIMDALASDPANVLHVGRVGLRFRDPRVRWSAKPGRDPCLIDLAEHESGDAIATYYYPTTTTGRIPVVRVRASTGEARWLADDFDAWFAGYLHDARAKTPDLVAIATQVLGVDASFVKPLAGTLPPPWFFEAHGTRWTLFDVEEARRAGDVAGAERMLVALGRNGYADRVKTDLASVYATLGWEHHRATVLETW
jgi:hypothetical protein